MGGPTHGPIVPLSTPTGFPPQSHLPPAASDISRSTTSGQRPDRPRPVASPLPHRLATLPALPSVDAAPGIKKKPGGPRNCRALRRLWWVPHTLHSARTVPQRGTHGSPPRPYDPALPPTDAGVPLLHLRQPPGRKFSTWAARARRPSTLPPRRGMYASRCAATRRETIWPPPISC